MLSQKLPSTVSARVGLGNTHPLSTPLRAARFEAPSFLRKSIPGKIFNGSSKLSPTTKRYVSKSVIDKSMELKNVPLKTEVESVSDSKKILCEFALQAFFNFFSCSFCAMALKVAGDNALHQTLMIMFSHAILLPLTIYPALHISGAHFNPMVTSCFVMLGKMTPTLGLGYIIAQCLGGIIGAGAAFSSLPVSQQTIAHSGIQAIPTASTLPQAFLGEVYSSFALVFILMLTNVDPRSVLGPMTKPLVIPAVICSLMWVMGPVSSMCINPARALGPAVITGYWDYHWVWWTAPFIGGFAATRLYKSFLPRAIQHEL